MVAGAPTRRAIRAQNASVNEPVLPGRIIRDVHVSRAEGVEGAETHLVNDEEHGEGSVSVSGIKGDGFVVVWAEVLVVGVVNEDELASLIPAIQLECYIQLETERSDIPWGWYRHRTRTQPQGRNG